jgi:CIC family chloride channel protein
VSSFEPSTQSPQPPRATFPAGHAMLMGLAAVVGLYGGLAAGLFANFIALFQTVFFRPLSLVHALSGQNQAWWRAFREQLPIAPWHLEYIAIAAIGVAGSQFLAHLVEREHVRLPAVVQPHQIQAIGWLLGLGLLLFYPLLALTTFNRAFDVEHGTFLDALMRAPTYWRVLGPAAGGLLVGLLLRYVTPESGGHGVAEVIEAINVRDKPIPTRVAVWKAVVSGLTIGSGGSAGREGPVVQIGGALANGLATRFRLTREQTRLLMACGGAAGIAASFNSPMGGTLFGLEIILGDFAMRSITPIAFAAVAATVTGRSLIAAQGEIVHIQFHVASGLEIGPYVLLGILSAIVSVLYVQSVHGVEHALSVGRRLSRLRPELRAMLGGLLVGLIGLGIPRVLGNGYETMNAALQGQLTATVLFVVLIGKIAASGLTLGSGMPGGSFFPAVFMGAMLGGGVGTVGHELFPSLIAGPSAYAAVGMAAVVAGATQAPLTAILMLFELTGSYDIILPLMIACTTSVAGSYWWLGGSMYTLKLRSKGIHLQDGRTDPLSRIRVGEVMTTQVVTVAASASFQEILSLVQETRHSAFPVVDPRGRLRGLLLVEQLRPFLGRGDDIRPAVAADVAAMHCPVAVAGETLEIARRRMLAEGVSHLPVVDETQHDLLVGILSHKDILTAFKQERVGEGAGAAD